jgi:hypothetical protein
MDCSWYALCWKDTTMTAKPDQNISKTSNTRPVRKGSKGPTETARLFIDVNEVIRRTQSLALTRYVE